MRTWKQQKQHEKDIAEQSRREWLQALCDSDKNMREISLEVEMNPPLFSKMCIQHGISSEGKQKRILTRAVMQSALDRKLTLDALCAETGVTIQAVKAAENREDIYLRRYAHKPRKPRVRKKPGPVPAPKEKSPRDAAKEAVEQMIGPLMLEGFTREQAIRSIKYKMEMENAAASRAFEHYEKTGQSRPQGFSAIQPQGIVRWDIT